MKGSNTNHLLIVFTLKSDTAVASWLERLKVVGSIPSRDRPKSLKVVVMAFPLGAQDYENSTTIGPPVSGYWTG